MENIVLRINKKEILKRVGDICQQIIVIALMFLFVTHFQIQNEVWVVLICMGVGAIPSIVLLIEYLRNVLKIEKVEFTPEYFNIVYKTTNKINIQYSDIKLVILYKSASKDKRKGNFTIFINEDYYFFGVITKTHQKFVFPSLFGPALGDALDMMKNVPMIREKTGFALSF